MGEKSCEDCEKQPIPDCEDCHKCPKCGSEMRLIEWYEAVSTCLLDADVRIHRSAYNCLKCGHEEKVK